MANTASAKKRIRRIMKRTALNKSRRSRMRTYIKKFEEALHGGDQSLVVTAFQAVEPEVMKAAQYGIIHKNAAARKVSRLAKKMNLILQ